MRQTFNGIAYDLHIVGKDINLLVKSNHEERVFFVAEPGDRIAIFQAWDCHADGKKCKGSLNRIEEHGDFSFVHCADCSDILAVVWPPPDLLKSA